MPLVDDAGNGDEIILEMNGERVENLLDRPPVPRPAENAPRAKWVEYAVKNGADRNFIEGKTQHYDSEKGTSVSSKKMTRNEVRDYGKSLAGG